MGEVPLASDSSLSADVKAVITLLPASVRHTAVSVGHTRMHVVGRSTGVKAVITLLPARVRHAWVSVGHTRMSEGCHHALACDARYKADRFSNVE